MKPALLWLLTCLMVPAAAQDSIWFTRSGHIYFISHTAIIDIDADNYQVGSMLDIHTGEMAFSLLMKTFQFTLPLAEEHFNENYVESHKYPKSTFKGRILDYSPEMVTGTEPCQVLVEGELTLHGVTRKIKEAGTLRREEGGIRAVSQLFIKLSDYQIKVPALVADRVAPVIPVDVDILYKPMGGK